MVEFTFSNRAQSIDEALSIYFNQIVADLKGRGCKITTLSLGEAFFELPMFDFGKLDKELCFHYSSSRGIPELRNKIAAYYRARYGAEIDPASEVLVTAGSKIAIYISLLACVNPGNRIAIHEPAWLSYQEHARLLEADAHFIPFDCPIGDFHTHFTTGTRVLIINNPNNPAGRLYTPDELASLYRQCSERGIYLLVDEAYSDFLHNEEFRSIAHIVPDLDGVILVNSLSKNMGLSGFRIGYVIARKDFIEHCLKLNQHLITCAPSILQYYLVEYFDRIIEITLPQARELMAKRTRIAATIDAMGLGRMQGESTFYFFISLGDYAGDALDFALGLLLFDGVSVVPGMAYGRSTERFVRVSVGTEDEDSIVSALKKIRRALSSPPIESGKIEEALKNAGLPCFHSGRRQ